MEGDGVSSSLDDIRVEIGSRRGAFGTAVDEPCSTVLLECLLEKTKAETGSQNWDVRNKRRRNCMVVSNDEPVGMWCVVGFLS